MAIEFLGPLAVAVAASRRPRDLLWVGLAAASVAALTLPRADLGATEAAGVALALVAAAGWAAYIVAAKGLGRAWPGSHGLALAVAVAALVTTPAGLARSWGHLDPELLAVAAAVGVLATAVPYSLELAALRRVGRGAFGVMLVVDRRWPPRSGWSRWGRCSRRWTWSVWSASASPSGASCGDRRRRARPGSAPGLIRPRGAAGIMGT